ncbi:MAG: hypothetical protein U9R51_01725 [Actinomycetota bacterium]|nr:hypothetical protein [Actinomycetota bacterium]
MNSLGYAMRRWWFKRFHRTVRIGWAITTTATKSNDVPKLGLGLAMIGFGLVKGRSNRRLIYKTSIDVEQGTTIRVMRGRRPIAETAPIR